MSEVRAPLSLFLVSVVAISGVVAAGVSMRGALREADAAHAQAAADLAEAERFRALRERTSRKVRSLLLTSDGRYAREVQEAETAFSGILRRLDRRALSAEERGRVARIDSAEKERRLVTRDLLQRKLDGAGIEEIASVLERNLQPVVDRLDGEVAVYVETRRRDQLHQRARSARVAAGATRLLWIAGGLAVLVAAVTAIALARSLRRHASHAAELARKRERDNFFELSLDMVCVAGTDGYFKQLNPAFEVVLGIPRADLLAVPFIDLVHPDDIAPTAAELARLAEGQATVRFENRYRCGDGSYRWLSWQAIPDPSGAVYALARDVTEAKANEAQLQDMAVLDELTGLHNRRGFTAQAEQRLAAAAREGRGATLFLADLDGLKQINDVQGHEVGDLAIRAGADVLRAAFRGSDVVARLGGDEFVVLAVGATPESEPVLLARLEALVEAFNRADPPPPFRLAVSIGSAIREPGGAEPLDELMRRADTRMYERKAARKAARDNVVT